METFSIQQLKAARILQSDIPLTVRPFTAIADACGLTGNDLPGWIKELSQKGIVRKFGAILRHQKAGYRKNALVMWSVLPDAVDNAGRAFAALPYISHCYERKPAFQNKYNLFTMLHAQEDDISPLTDAMSRLINNSDFLLLESLQEYKKTSP
jgi:siroheme decarboxylase